jgi:hypothetical protein
METEIFKIMIELTARDILFAKNVGDIFTNDKNIIKSEYIVLSKRWHPDYNDNSDESNAVMSKINLLYDNALKLIENKKWEGNNFLQLCDKNNKLYHIKYLSRHNFELGSMFICDDKVVYLLDKDYKNFYINYMNNIKTLKYADDKMKSEFNKYLPIKNEYFETNDNKFAIIVNKTDDLFLLEDVWEYYSGNIPDRHVAWILSSLYNIACYLNYNNISHNGIDMKNYFISPKYHSGALLGGWWYTVNTNQKMLGISKSLYDVLPPRIKEDKLGNITTDLESIRLIGKQLLGEKNGCKIKYNKNLPQPIVNWLLMGSSENAFVEYSKWNTVLTNAYGKRKFIDMGLSSEILYKNLSERRK